MENYNDGRKKTFYCLAVNLIELPYLQEVMRQIKDKEIERDFSVKEKAAYVTGMFQAIADQRQITLKLRRKPRKDKK